MRDSPHPPLTYQQAGVDIDAGAEAVRLFKSQVEATHGPEVLTGIGSFGGLFQFPTGYVEPVLVASTDSVGSKIKLATQLERYDTVGQDIVNHCINDILTLGARPLFFLDYVGVGRLVPEVMRDVVSGAAVACKDAGCALLGGELAEIPDLYAAGDLDFAGTIVGVVERAKIVSGERIENGDAVLAFPSNGLHTNGYSLARRVFAADAFEVTAPTLGATLADALLAVHTCYLHAVQRLCSKLDIKGMAHITGGGLWDNIPRVLPQGTQVRLHWGSWPVPPIFPLLQQRGGVEFDEMCRVFNMGVGYVVICDEGEAAEALRLDPTLHRIGVVESHTGDPRVVISR
ncbi:MAG: phosphoribosylformylglycinamidine cyclo-ligase [Chloroflexi bacterium]|nr:phosphoribosylformylglycinamidine cyclo-ligase [Chloroflexota bacterium]